MRCDSITDWPPRKALLAFGLHRHAQTTRIRIERGHAAVEAAFAMGARIGDLDLMREMLAQLDKVPVPDAQAGDVRPYGLRIRGESRGWSADIRRRNASIRWHRPCGC